MTKRVLIGEIATVHGVRGLVKLHVYADNLDLFDAPLFTGETGDATLCLTLKNAMKDHWLAEIENVADRTAAEKFRGTKLYVERDALPAPGKGEYYHVDLIGMTCIDETGAPVGEIIGIDNFGAGDLLDIKPPQGPSFYLPFTDETVLNIGERVTVSIPEGLKE